MNIIADLTAKGTVVAGLRGSGKTNFARLIANVDQDAVLVYDPLGQYPEFDRIEPKQRSFPQAAEEFARIIKKYQLRDASKHNYRLLIIDEAQRLAPVAKALNRDIALLNSEHRHIPLGIVWIARRPRELHAEIINLADHMMIFRLPGATDFKFLEDTAKGLGEKVRNLTQYQFTYVDQDRRYWNMEKITEQTAAGGLDKA